MKLPNIRVLVLLVALVVVLLIATGMLTGETAANGTREARALALQEMLGSIEGTPREAPQIFKTKEGYLRFVGAPPSTHFAVVPGAPEEAANAFLEQWRNLFVTACCGNPGRY